MGYKRKSNDAADKLLSQGNTGEEADEDPFNETNLSTGSMQLLKAIVRFQTFC